MRIETGAADLGGGIVGAHEADEFVGERGGDASISEAVLDAAECGKLAEHLRTTERDEEICCVADGGIGRDAFAAVSRMALAIISRSDLLLCCS